MSSNIPNPVQRALKKLGRDVFIARRARKMSQADLALRIDSSVSTVKRIEDGSPGTSLHTFLRVLHVLGKLDEIYSILSLEKDALGMSLLEENLPRRVHSSRKFQELKYSATDKNITLDKSQELEGF